MELEMRSYLEHTKMDVKPLKDGDKLDILITVYAKGNRASVRISRTHCNIVYIEKDGEVYNLETTSEYEENEQPKIDKGLLNIEDIVRFANEVNIEDIKEVLDQQIAYNYAIAKEGMAQNWGANIGSVMVKTSGDDVQIMSKALAAAGSDARMGVCAAKIAVSVEAGILGYFMYQNGQQFYAEDGIVSNCVETTIQNICRLGGNAMNETDEEIIRIMTHCD